MQRREFTAPVGVAFAWPIALKAQQPGKVYRLALFNAGSRSIAVNLAVFIDALRDLGWIEGKNIVIEERYAEDQLDRLPEMAADLVRLNVDIIVTVGTLAPRRRWFACQGCAKSCRVLYGSGRFLCRRCWGLPYRSQGESHWSRTTNLMQKIRGRLGGSANLLEAQVHGMC